MTESKPESQKSPPSVAASKSASGFPKADVRPARLSVLDIVRGSRLWWITLVCLFIAFGLVWAAIPERGPEITIRFPEGHGLRAGDSLRHRGIEIGVVTSVSMNQQFSGVIVVAELQPSAEAVAREGSRFWIVRPQIGLEGISGLETAVGAKYIEVSPAEPGSGRADVFSGLPAAPPDELAPDGLRLVLRSTHRHGLTPGAPVTWRGVEVGQVLSVNLSPDARFVDASVRIDGQFERLVRPTSKFWVNSGLNVDVGLTGVSVAAESLSTLTKGGVAFITPAADAGAATVRAGQIFTLAAAPEESWLEDADHVPLVDIDLPQTVSVKIKGTRKTLLISHSTIVASNGFVIALTGSQPTGVLVAPVPAASSLKLSEPVEVAMMNPGGDAELTVGTDLQAESLTQQSVILIPVAAEQVPAAAIPISMIGSDKWPQSCGAVHSVVDSQGRVSSVILTIGENEMEETDGRWHVSTEGADSEAWHGSPVVALTDGRIVGILIATGDGAYIESLDASDVGG